MDIMVNSEMVKNLRKRNAWTQDQLATVAGLSLRTIQRVEKEGVCSLETNQALASVFELTPTQLRYNAMDEHTHSDYKMGKLWGMAGITLGFVSAYLAISYAFFNGSLSGMEAGLWYGSIGFFCGLNFLVIGVLSDYLHKTRATHQ